MWNLRVTEKMWEGHGYNLMALMTISEGIKTLTFPSLQNETSPLNKKNTPKKNTTACHKPVKYTSKKNKTACHKPVKYTRKKNKTACHKTCKIYKKEKYNSMPNTCKIYKKEKVNMP